MRTAAEAWDPIGCPYHQAVALFDAEDAASVDAAIQTLERLGATPLLSAARDRHAELTA